MSESTPEGAEEPTKRPWVLPLAIAILLALMASIYLLYPVIQRDLGGTALAKPHPSPRATPLPSPVATPTTIPKPKPKPKPKPPPPVKHGLKAPIAGLLDQRTPPSSAFYSVMDGYVVNANWSLLQPSPGGPIAGGNIIDRAIAQVRSANASGAHLALKIRVFAGIKAPDWAKNIGGPPIPVRDPLSNVSGTVGRFWTPAFGSAYRDLENKLAARYDTVPEIREITISRCMTVYAETFIRNFQDPTTVANLWRAGYTVAQDQACIREQIQAHAVWIHTRSDLAFNPLQEILSLTQVKSDMVFTMQMMSYCRQVLGARCVLENNSLRATSSGQLFTSIRGHGANISFQTAALGRIGDVSITLVNAVGFGAASVELPIGYQAMGPAVFSPVRSRLIANLRA